MFDAFTKWLQKVLGGKTEEKRPSAQREPERRAEAEPVSQERAPPPAERRRRKKKPRASRARTRRRRYHLGLDWGTSTTKMVLRDYDEPGSSHGRAYVLRPSRGGYRYPSTVTLAEGKLWFGDEAEARRGAGRTWDSLKAAAAVQRGWANEVEDLPGVTLEELSALSIAHYCCVGFADAERHASSRRATPRMGMTLSVPVASLQIPTTQEAYQRVAAAGYRLGAIQREDPQGRSPGELIPKLRDARAGALEGLDDLAFDTYLRAEVVAAMVWPFMSPRVGEGPYTVIDIGAATTNASWFRIHGGRDVDGVHRRKSSMAFFGASTRRPGMDHFDQILAEMLGKDDPVSLRGSEERLLKRVRDTGALRSVTEKYYETWAEARRNAWPKANRLTHWENLQILVVGGGSKIDIIQKQFDQLPGYFRANLKKFKHVGNPGVPGDLWELSGRGTAFSEEATFLLVAYGLSFHSGDMPDVSLPSQVSPFRHEEFRRRFKSSAELGYDNP